MMANYRDKIKKSNNKSRYSGLLVAGSVMLNKNQKKKRERGKEKKRDKLTFCILQTNLFLSGFSRIAL